MVRRIARGCVTATTVAARAVGGCALTVAALGCSYEWHAVHRPPRQPSTVPAPIVDRAASEVLLRSRKGVTFAEGEAEEVRQALANAMETVVRPHNPEDRAPARYRVVATLERRGAWSFAYIVLVPAPFLGAPIFRVHADVEVEVEIDGELRRGRADTRVFGGFFYNYNAREKALARAFRSALYEALWQTGVGIPVAAAGAKPP